MSKTRRTWARPRPIETDVLVVPVVAQIALAKARVNAAYRIPCHQQERRRVCMCVCVCVCVYIPRVYSRNA